MNMNLQSSSLLTPEGGGEGCGGNFSKASLLSLLRNRPMKDFRMFAILLMEEQRNDPNTKASSSLPEATEDIMTQVGSILKDRIRAHSEIDAALFTAEDVIKKNTRALVPLMYRMATVNFAKTSRDTFKVIECRNSTKLISDWKPTIADLLISLEHQVIIVHLQKSLIPSYDDYVYAVLHQLDYSWKFQLPRSVFYPNNVCKLEGTQDRDLIVVFPTMSGCDLEISRKMSSLNYELIMMFKRSCQSAMTNYLLMQDMRVEKFQDSTDVLESIRTLYKKFQTRLKEGGLGGQSRLGSREVEKSRFASPATFTTKPLIPCEDKEFELSFDDDDADFHVEVSTKSYCGGDVGKFLEDLSVIASYGKLADSSTEVKEQGSGDTSSNDKTIVHAGGDDHNCSRDEEAAAGGVTSTTRPFQRFRYKNNTRHETCLAKKDLVVVECLPLITVLLVILLEIFMKNFPLIWIEYRKSFIKAEEMCTTNKISPRSIEKTFKENSSK